MFGDDDSEPNREAALLLALEFCKLDMPLLLSQKLALLDFESRKDAAQACYFAFLGGIYFILESSPSTLSDWQSLHEIRVKNAGEWDVAVIITCKLPRSML